METREEPLPAVRKVFGREPIVEDARYVGRWAYAASWLAEDRLVARELVRARMAFTAPAAVNAAMGAGPGGAERFALVGALSRVADGPGNVGTLVAALDRAVDLESAQLLDEGARLRDITYRERFGSAPSCDFESLQSGIRDAGPDRNVMLREAAKVIDAALGDARGPCSALRTMRLFLTTTLSEEGHDASGLENALHGAIHPIPKLAAWLNADFALLSRRSSAYTTAWAHAARTAGDALSKTVAGLTSGSLQAYGVVEAYVADPWAMVYALAMTNEPKHASAILDCGVNAQNILRSRAERRLAQWAAQVQTLEEMEERFGIAILASYEHREGHRNVGAAHHLDMFSAWYVVEMADEAVQSLRDAIDSTIKLELERREKAVRKARESLERTRQAFEASIEAARTRLGALDYGEISTPEEEAGAQRGCLLGFAAGGSVMATYLALGLLMSNNPVVERMGPIVLGIATVPVGAAVTVQVAHAIRRSMRATEAAKKRVVAEAKFEEARLVAEKEFGETLARKREELEEAEAILQEFERLAEAETKVAA